MKVSRELFVVAVAMLVTGCVKAANSSTTLDPSGVAGYYSGIPTERFEVMREQEQFTALWSAHTQPFSSPEPQPYVDFDTDMVIAVFLGTRPTGGYAIEVAGIEETADSIVVQVRGVTPGAGCGVTDALTQPYHIIPVPKSDKAVAFMTAIDAVPCV